MYDFKISDGLVFDALKGTFNKTNVYIADDKIALVADETYKAKNVIDAKGKFVCPGLVDEHLHLDYNGSIIGANGDLICIPNGVTTACDGGSCGASNFPLFYSSNIIRYEAKTYAYLNVSTFGNKSLCLHEEDHDPSDFRFDLIQKCFKKFNPIIRGLKVRMCKATLGNNLGISPLENVRVSDLFSVLRKGDVVAHIFQDKGETIFDDYGKVKPAVLDAQKRGVIMDDCHGRVHWTIPNLQKAFNQGFFPDVISSDAVRISEYIRPGFSLIYAINIAVACGMPIEKVLKAVTKNPADVLGINDAGVILKGKTADIVILDNRPYDGELFDNYGNGIKVNNILAPLLTIKDGRVAFRQIYF